MILVILTTLVLLATLPGTESLRGPGYLAKYNFRTYTTREDVGLGDLESNENYTYASYETGWFTQNLDHYNFENNQTFQMRYLHNSTWWDKENDGPVLFYCGNEGTIDGFWNNSGFMYNNMAQDLGALLLFAEHRYFGQSFPQQFPNPFEPENIKWLSVEQAMADYANFLTDFKKNNCSSCPIIAMGGSYGGMLASWMRSKYPNIIDGAIACSAPFLMFTGVTDPYGYMHVATNDYLETTVPQCAEVIHQGFNYLDEFAEDESEYAAINEDFMVCESEAVKSSEDMRVLEDWLTEAYQTLAMVNYPYPADLIGPVPGNPVQEVCDYFEDLSVDSSPSDIFGAMLEGALVYFDYEHTESCYDIHEEQPTGQEDGANGWYFLECQDMVMPVGSNGITDMFPERLWSNEEWTEHCQKDFGLTPRDNWALDYFGGRHPYELASFTNIFYSNGNLDPWSSGGLKATLTDSLPSFVITGGAHHLDLRAPNPVDPPSVAYARELEMYYARKWINEKLNVQGPSEQIPQMKVAKE